MSYTIEKTKIDLEDTAIENIFLTEFMPSAQGTYVKVYLLAYQYAKNKRTHKFTHESLAKILNMPLTDVLEAWDYWANKGIIKKVSFGPKRGDFDVDFLSLKQLFIEHLIAPPEPEPHLSQAIDDETLFRQNQYPEVNSLFTTLSVRLRRPLVTDELKLILSWLRQYSMTCAMILRAVDLAENQKGHIRLSYVGGIIKNWYDHHITNEDALESFLSVNNAAYYHYYKIMNALGLSRNPSEAEKKKMIKWLNEWHYPLEIVLLACDENIKIDKPNIQYTDAILTDWHKNQLDTVEKVRHYLEKREQKNTPVRKKNTREVKSFENKYKKLSNQELEQRFIKNLQK